MPQRTIECPSGLAGVVRGLKGREGNLLTDQREMQSGRALDRILAACWTETTAPGPYPQTENGVIDWSRLLVCDHFYALMQVRIATYGNTYSFGLACPSCRERFEWDLPLDELPVRALPEASRERVKAADNRFDHVLSDGRRLVFRLPTVAEVRRAVNAVRQHTSETVVRAIASRTIEIDGGANTPATIVDALNEMEMGELPGVLAALEAIDGGVETEVDVTCPHCGSRLPVELPFGREYWLPKRTPTP